MIIIFSMAQGPRLAVSMGSSLETQEVFCAAAFFFETYILRTYKSDILSMRESSSGIFYLFFSDGLSKISPCFFLCSMNHGFLDQNFNPQRGGFQPRLWWWRLAASKATPQFPVSEMMMGVEGIGGEVCVSAS